MRNAEIRDILQCVAIPDNREVAPLADSHTVSLRMKAGGVVVVAESRIFDTLKNKTLNLGKKIHSVFSVNTSACTMAINIDDNPVNMIIDSGSSCNIIPEATFRKMPGLTLKCCNNRVYAYASHNPLQVVGCCDVKMLVHGGGHVNTATVLVVKGDHAALLGRKTAEQLGVLRVGLAENVYTTDVLTKEKLREMYPQVFSGLGKLKNYQLELNIDESVKPVAQPIRRIPFSRREKVEEKLRELEDMDVIEKVDSPTTWMNPLVTVEKPNGDIRVCLDMRDKQSHRKRATTHSYSRRNCSRDGRNESVYKSE